MIAISSKIFNQKERPYWKDRKNYELGKYTTKDCKILIIIANSLIHFAMPKWLCKNFRKTGAFCFREIYILNFSVF